MYLSFTTKLYVVVAIVSSFCSTTNASTTQPDCEAVASKMNFFSTKLHSEGCTLLADTTNALEYLSENTWVRQDEDVKGILDSMLELSQAINNAYVAAPQDMLEEVKQCSAYLEVGPQYDGQTQIATNLRQSITRKLIRGAMVGTIQESLPAGHIKDRQLLLDEFKVAYLPRVNYALKQLYSELDSDEAKDVYQHWDTGALCDDIIAKGCTLIDTMTTFLGETNDDRPSICSTQVCQHP